MVQHIIRVLDLGHPAPVPLHDGLSGLNRLPCGQADLIQAQGPGGQAELRQGHGLRPHLKGNSGAGPEPGPSNVRAAGDLDSPAAAEEAGPDVRPRVAAQGLLDPGRAGDEDIAARPPDPRADGGGMAHGQGGDASAADGDVSHRRAQGPADARAAAGLSGGADDASQNVHGAHGPLFSGADARAAAGSHGGDGAAPDPDAAGPAPASAAVPADARAPRAAGSGQGPGGIPAALPGLGTVHQQGGAVSQGDARPALAAFEEVFRAAAQKQRHVVLPAQVKGPALGHLADHAAQGQLQLSDAVRQGQPPAEGLLIGVGPLAAGDGGDPAGQDAQGVGLLLVDPVRARLSAGDGERIRVKDGFRKGPGALVPAEVGVAGLGPLGLVLPPDDDRMDRRAPFSLLQPQPGGLAAEQRSPAVLAVHRQGGDGAPAREQGAPHDVKGGQGLPAPIGDMGGLSRQEHRSVDHHGDRQRPESPALLRRGQNHRAAGQAQDVAHIAPERADAHQPAAPQNQGRAGAQPDLPQGRLPGAGDLNGGSLCGQHRDAGLPQGHRSEACQPDGAPFLGGPLENRIRRPAYGQLSGGGAGGHAGELPARHFHVPQIQNGGLCPVRRRCRQFGSLPGGIVQSGLRPGFGALDHRQQPHHQLQVHPLQPRQQVQQGGFGQEGGVPAGEQQLRQKVLHPWGGAAQELGLQVREAGKHAVCQQLHRPVRRDALGHLFQELPQSLQGRLHINGPGGGAPGDDSAQVQRRQIACGVVALQGFFRQDGQNVRNAGALVQAQQVQQPLRGQAGVGHALQQPMGELLHALLALVLQGGVRKRLRSVVDLRVPIQKQPRVSGEGPAGHAVDFLRQLCQLRLEGGCVCPAASGGPPDQPRHAAQAVLDLRQHGLPGLEGSVAVPRVVLRLADRGHQPPEGL